MNQQEFDELWVALDKRCRDIHADRNPQYATERDVLDNFKREAEDLGLTKFQILSVYKNKHGRAIRNAIKKRPSEPGNILENIADEMNYLRFLAALLIETGQISFEKSREENVAEYHKTILG